MSHPTPIRLAQRWATRDPPANADGRACNKLRKQPVEPVFGQIKGARGFRQFLRRDPPAVQSERAMLRTVHNLLKLQKATLQTT